MVDRYLSEFKNKINNKHAVPSSSTTRGRQPRNAAGSGQAAARWPGNAAELANRLGLGKGRVGGRRLDLRHGGGSWGSQVTARHSVGA